MSRSVRLKCLFYNGDALKCCDVGECYLDVTDRQTQK